MLLTFSDNCTICSVNISLKGSTYVYICIWLRDSVMWVADASVMLSTVQTYTVGRCISHWACYTK